MDAFFASGEAEIAEVLRLAETLGYPRQHERALDFGCGVGRLTRALADSFEEAVGLDISAEMVRLARELNEDRRNCRFEVNAGWISDARVGLLRLRLLVPGAPAHAATTWSRPYIGEFLRVLRPGGLVVFQASSTFRSPCAFSLAAASTPSCGASASPSSS